MKIAIVGGIGSGKSEVLNVAREMGLACLSADKINAELLESPEYIAEIAKAFPTSVKDGRIDKAALAAIVFADDRKRAKLNEIAHPRILKRIREASEDLLIVEMPLLLESGAQDIFDEIVLVYTPLELRLTRLEKRGLSRDDAGKRIRAQVDEDALKAVATRVIDNSADIDALQKNAETVFSKLKHNA